MSTFEDLNDEVNRGIEGKNAGLSMGFKRLHNYVSLRRKVYSVIMAGTGVGKSAFLHNAFILNPYDRWILDKDVNKPKFKVILFSMERSKTYTVAKWLSRKIFIDHGILIEVPKLLGWWSQKMSKDEHDYFLSYQDYIDEMIEGGHVAIIDGGQNPTGIYKYVKTYAEKIGKVEQIDEYNKVFVPNDPTQITIVAGDHGSLVRREKGMSTKKEAIDKTSEYFQMFRDFYGFSPVLVMQQNRDIASPLLLKTGDVEPTLEMAKDSGTPLEDADLVISLFNPLRYNQADPSGYNIQNFRDPETGNFYFRSLKILKSTYSEADVRIGMAFMGSLGTFEELPKANKMETFNYGDLFSGIYFLRNNI